MKYTRYNIRKKRNFSGVVIILLITVFALAGGTVLARIIFKEEPGGNNSSNVNQPSSKTQIKEKDNSTKNVKESYYFCAIQCGYFGNKDNAEKTKKEISDNKIDTIIINDNSKYRLIAFIGDEKESGDIVNKLKEKSINSMKIKFEIPRDNDIDNQVCEIINGYLKLVSTLNKDDVKSVKTSEFKKWTSQLKNIDNGNDVQVLSELKKNIKSLPDEIKKDNIETMYQSLFSVMSHYK